MRRPFLTSLCLVMVLLAVSAFLPTSAERTQAECLDLGFDKDVVRCKHCEKLYMITQSTELQQECRDCCVGSIDEGDNAVSADAKYVAARIEVRGIFRLIDATSMNMLALFYRTYKEEPYFEYLSFDDKYSVTYPQVVLVKDKGEDAVTLRIGGWSPETLNEFLTKKIDVE